MSNGHQSHSSLERKKELEVGENAVLFLIVLQVQESFGYLIWNKCSRSYVFELSEYGSARKRTCMVLYILVSFLSDAFGYRAFILLCVISSVNDKKDDGEKFFEELTRNYQILNTTPPSQTPQHKSFSIHSHH